MKQKKHEIDQLVSEKSETIDNTYQLIHAGQA